MVMLLWYITLARDDSTLSSNKITQCTLFNQSWSVTRKIHVSTRLQVWQQNACAISVISHKRDQCWQRQIGERLGSTFHLELTSPEYAQVSGPYVYLCVRCWRSQGKRSGETSRGRQAHSLQVKVFWGWTKWVFEENCIHICCLYSQLIRTYV